MPHNLSRRMRTKQTHIPRCPSVFFSSLCAISAFGPRCVYLAPIKKGRSLARLPHSFDSKGKGQCVCAEKKRQCERRKRPMCVRLYSLSAHPSNQQWQEAREVEEDRDFITLSLLSALPQTCYGPNYNGGLGRGKYFLR